VTSTESSGVDDPRQPTPAFTILLDHPRASRGRGASRLVGDLIGAVLLVVGLVASIPALPATLAVVSFVLGWATTDPSDPDPWPSPDVPVFEIAVVCAITLPLAVGGLRFGLRILRRNRTMVLFLRKFGFDDAQSAVTFAVLRTIGASWRVVTLDDAEMAPIGVTSGTRRLFSGGRTVTRRILSFAQLIGVQTFPRLLLGMWAVIALALASPGIQFVLTGETSWKEWVEAIDPYVNILASVLDGNLPFEAIAPSLPGVFAALSIGAAVSFWVMLVTMFAIVLAFPLSTALFFVSSSADSVLEAERSKTVTVSSIAELLITSVLIARRSRRVFGPRLVVIRVASHLWQAAVRDLAARSSFCLIDISQPTENVLWELDELLPPFENRCVLIGHRERVAALASREPGSIERRLVDRIQGREVLAYETDARGLKRFARALRGLLLTRHA
jgi:hypothetical protein